MEGGGIRTLLVEALKHQPKIRHPTHIGVSNLGMIEKKIYAIPLMFKWIRKNIANIIRCRLDLENWFLRTNHH